MDRLKQHMYQNHTDFDMVLLCQSQQMSFLYKGVSNDVPQITENTNCIHPLLGKPGQPFCRQKCFLQVKMPLNHTLTFGTKESNSFISTVVI
jgi:hypothetical protein